ncbi:MAG: AMP-binding protein [Pseudobacteriovorax sp.]|nr:AMP-binding protein [Pseudobacteriovorax sp.]
MRVEQNIADFFERAATVFKDRIGIIDEPGPNSLGEMSYGELIQHGQALAAALDSMNISKGQRVAIVSKNSARFITAFYGVSGFGRILVPINYRLSSEDIQYIIDHSKSSLLLYDPDLETLVESLEGVQKLALNNTNNSVLFKFDAKPQSQEVEENFPASINYTSGTTAKPKGVVLTHRNLWTNAVLMGLHLGLQDNETYLHTLPMFHCNGWGMPYIVTGMGGRHIIIEKIDGHEILERIAKHNVTIMCGAPTVLQAVLAAAESWQGEIPGGGRLRVLVAGAPPPSSVIHQVRKTLNWEFMQLYGLTETSPLLTMNRVRHEWDDLSEFQKSQQLGKAGTPAIGVKLKISEEGEILAKSNSVLDHYWENPVASEAALNEGWFHTGDGGTLDESGYLTISDRKKDVIITGGENVSSIEVEDVIYSHPEVSEVAVIGAFHHKWGEQVTALVVLKAGANISEQEIIDYCRSQLSHFKCPKAVHFRTSLPRTATGKLQKYKLREPFWKNKRQFNHGDGAELT